MTQKIGPREQQLREIRERQYGKTRAPPPKKTIEALGQQLAAIPVHKVKSDKKKRR